jgi:hypothetical protein
MSLMDVSIFSIWIMEIGEPPERVPMAGRKGSPLGMASAFGPRG